MFIEKIEVTASNMMAIITDPSVYVIRKRFLTDGYSMTPIADADVKNLLDRDAAVIKITE